ncbi:hypothetical protein JOC37_001947 [Desulfohalotomaculum tongense]|uniref:DUF6544 family protein n=1 Tax=Desulforadius tongensis TaxID=1216062 RepID=UPI00195E2196|nr:DUF6544 family protein [Desulforadius tongensis]MBM7855550.1 hypothetical protein [Desulforadius tongensis]
MLKILLVILLGILVVLALVAAASFFANLQFNKNVDKEVRDFFGDVESRHDIIQMDDLDGLPPVVQKWLERSQVVGKERITAVRLKQKAFMRIKEGGPWMPADVQQYFRVDKPGFIWKVRVNMAPLLYFAGRDKYEKGSGHMLIKVLSLVKVADAKGNEIDQGSMLRYLAETVWFPSAALNSYIEWEEVDANSARAVMTYGGMTVSGLFTFNQEGDVINFIARRYGNFDGRYLEKNWIINVWEHKEFNGIRIPAAGEVTWELETGDYNWYRFEIKEIEYNKPAGY